METHHSTRRDERTAMLLSCIPGLGQFYNRQVIKGIGFLLITVLFIYELLTFGLQAIQNFVTLGSTPMEDHSLFMLIRGTIQIIVTVILIP